MSTIPQFSDDRPARVARAGDGLVRRAPQWAVRWLVPSLSDLFVIALFTWLFLAGAYGFKGLLSDGDIGWHIRTGDYILETRSVPQSDLFSFTRPGAPWFAWEWLSDVIFAVLHRSTGLAGVVLFAAVLIAAVPLIVLRHALWRGANAWAALIATLLAVGACSIHFLARPHVFTLLFTAAAAWLIEADRRKPTLWVWLLVPLAALWTNLHGGFGVLLGLLGLAFLGAFAEAWGRDGRFRGASRYAGLLCASAIATVANPYGIRLQAHIFNYLKSDWIRSAVDEFKAPDFRSESLIQFEILLIASLILVAVLVARRRYTDALWIVALAHMSLTSVRHVPLFAVVAAPVVAELATDLWIGLVARCPRGSVAAILDRIGSDLTPGFRRATVWPALFIAGVAGAGGAVPWPRDFPAERFPVEMVRNHAPGLKAGRVLTLDQWADYLIFRHYPEQRVFADGRSDFYGPELGTEYLRTAQGDFRWRRTLERFAVDTVLAPVEWPLVTILKGDPGWRLVADDGRAVLLGKAIP